MGGIFFGDGLKRFLTVNFLFVALVPALFMGGASLYFLNNHLREGVAQRNYVLARSLASEVGIFAEEPLSLMRQVQEIFKQDDLLSPSQINGYLNTIIKTYDYFDRIQVVDSEGLVQFVSQRSMEDIATSAAGQTFFKETLIHQRPYWSTSFISQQTGAPTVTLSLPLGDGVVVGYLNLDILSRLTRKFQRNNHSHAIIADRDGVAIAHVAQDFVAQRVNLKGLEEIRAGLNGFEGTYRRMSEHDDTLEELVSVVQVAATGWLVVYHQDVDEAYRPLRFMIFLMGITVLLTGFLAAFVAFFCLKKVFRPLAQFLAATKGIASGHYEIEIPTSFKEFNELGDDFRSMIAAIQQREVDLRYRLDFEAMLSQISTSFINLPTTLWQEGIEQALERVAHFLNVDRAYIFLYDDAGQTASCTYEWCGTGVVPVIDSMQKLTVADYVWFHQQFKDQGYVRLVSLDDLPAEADSERSLFGSQNFKSLLCVPMLNGEQLVGFVGFNRIHRQGNWSTDLIALLRLLVDLLHQTLQRQRSKLELERLHIAIDQTTEFILLLDVNGRVQYANPSFLAVCGVAELSIILGQLYKDLPPANPLGEGFMPIWDEISHNQHWQGRLSGTEADGTPLQQEITVSPVREESGAVSGYVLVGRDITKQLELEGHLQQTQKMESIGTLAGGIAHDFNNILSAIIGYVELASMRLEKNHPARQDLIEVDKASRRASELVNQILTFSRKGQKELDAVLIQPIIKEPLKLLRASLPTTIEIKQEINETGRVLVDPTQLHQVIMNICTNASHAMVDGGVLEIHLKETVLGDLEVALFPGLIPGKYVCLTIADTGCGMSPQVMAKIFDPYFTTKGKGKGTGLGLAVVQGIIKSFGGEIFVQSRLGEGTTFTIFLPVVEGDVNAVTMVEQDDIPRGHERVLLVDDEEVLTQLLEQMLGRIGYKVNSFNSSKEALASFENDPSQYDLVVSDMTMPEMTGLQLATKIKAIRPEIPILICTGYSEGLTRAKYEAAGVCLVLKKPVHQHQLAVAIRHVLNGKP